MNDQEMAKLIQIAAGDHVVADAVLDLMPESERELVVDAELLALGIDNAELAAIVMSVQRRLAPWRAALRHLQHRGLQVLHKADGLLHGVAVLPTERAIAFIRKAIAEHLPQPSLAIFGRGPGTIRVVVGDGDGPGFLAPLLSTPRWLREGKLRLVLQVPSDVEVLYSGLREGAALLHFGTESDYCASDIAFVNYLSAATGPRYLIDLPFSRPQDRDQAVASELLRELRLFPMPQ